MSKTKLENYFIKNCNLCKNEFSNLIQNIKICKNCNLVVQSFSSCKFTIDLIDYVKNTIEIQIFPCNKKIICIEYNKDFTMEELYCLNIKEINSSIKSKSVITEYIRYFRPNLSNFNETINKINTIFKLKTFS